MLGQRNVGHGALLGTMILIIADNSRKEKYFHILGFSARKRRSAALLKFLSVRRGRRDQAPPLFSGTSRKLILKDKGRAPFRLPAPFFIRVVRFTVSDIYTAIRSA